MSSPPTNRLAQETSPYLMQHANNPVDWFPWDDEALTLARKLDKPILLSIGYSACHWCHVMAHESFEDDATAAAMNAQFINIKVDREERPDIDKIYQTAHQLLTQQPGGWPLTMFLDPADQRPFFGGTYFPKEARFGMPAFVDLLGRVAEHFQQSRADIGAQGERLVDVFDQLNPDAAPADLVLDEAPIAAARERIEQNFDREFGGLGTAPKFPHPTTLDLLLRQWRESANDEEPDIDALFLASLTLTRMAEGGIYDQLGGGFCRYSVDRYWQIPHFEKMLYDNGPLLALYAQAHIATGEPLFARIAHETGDYLLADLRSSAGGFFSTRDADSEGEEGLYYVWTPELVQTLLTEADFAVFAPYFGLDQPANFEGNWHLAVRRAADEVARDAGLDERGFQEAIARSKHLLLAERATRTEPGRDEKHLTSWNALAIRGLAIAGRALERNDFVDAAAAAVDFIEEQLLSEGRLLAVHKDGESRFSAYLDDHAFLLDALLELLQSRWQTTHLRLAMRVADLLLEHFEDSDSGGFYFTAADAEALIHRPKPLADEAMPAGNGVAAFALQRLGFLLGESRYLDAAERTLRFAWRAMDEYPHGHVSLLTALDEHIRHPEIIVIRGNVEDIDRWQATAAKIYAPRRLVFAIARHEAELPGALADRSPVANETVAYRCVGTHCSLPLNSFEALAAEMS